MVCKLLSLPLIAEGVSKVILQTPEGLLGSFFFYLVFPNTFHVPEEKLLFLFFFFLFLPLNYCVILSLHQVWMVSVRGNVLCKGQMPSAQGQTSVLGKKNRFLDKLLFFLNEWFVCVTKLLFFLHSALKEIKRIEQIKNNSQMFHSTALPTRMLASSTHLWCKWHI